MENAVLHVRTQKYTWKHKSPLGRCWQRFPLGLSLQAAQFLHSPLFYVMVWSFLQGWSTGLVLGRHWRGTRALRACFTPTWSHLCCDMLVGTRPNATSGHLPALGRGEHALTSPRANSLPNASSKSLLRMWPAEMPASKWAATPWH